MPPETEKATTARSGSSDIDAAQAMLMDRFGGDDQPEKIEPAPEPVEEDDQQQDDEADAEAEAPEADADDADVDPEDNDSDDDEGADDEPEEKPDEAPKLYRVKIDGEEQEVSEDELVKGYQRQSDYTRKTMEIAEQRRQAEAASQELMAERQQAAQAREQYLARVTEMEQAYDAVQEPDWAALLQEAQQTEDWASYHQKQQAWQQLVKQRDSIKAQKEQATREQQEAQQRAYQERLQREQQFVAQERDKLFERIPEWKDEAKRTAEITEIARGGRDYYGLTEQEIGQIVDHRHLLLLRDAVKHRQRQAAAKTKVQQATTPKKAPKLQAPTAPPPPRNKVTEKARNMKQLRKSGSTEDAARLLLDRM